MMNEFLCVTIVDCHGNKHFSVLTGKGERTMVETIAQIMAKLTDRELIEMLPYIRNENGERMSLIELKHYLRQEELRYDN